MSGPFFLRRKTLNKFENKVAEFVRGNNLFAEAEKILLAVSGGADSTALLYVLCALKDNGVVKSEFVCAHTNHQLRGAEADADERFVIEQATKLDLPVITKKLDVRGFAKKNKLSIETAARKLRIENLLEIAKENKCGCAATAHQKNDNAETIIQRLRRGTGFRGLAGIWPKRKFGDVWFVRPLLCASRDEIIEYLNSKNLKWQTDRTNEDCRYKRNYIRHLLLPALQDESGSSFVERLFDLSTSTQRFCNLVDNYTDNIRPALAERDRDVLKLDVEKFLEQPEAVKVELVRRCLNEIGEGERDLTEGHYKKILQMAERKTGSGKIELPGGFTVIKEQGKLIFTRPQKIIHTEQQADRQAVINIPGRTRFEQYSIEATILDAERCDFEKFKAEKTVFVEGFDFDNLKLPLVVRFRRAGDRFVPLGLAAEKKIGKFLTDSKLPQRRRGETLIVADAEKIIWLWPVRISERAKITSQTHKIVQVQITTAHQQ
jgi:tRNA(Ile)-lysidine synthase